MKCCLFLSHWEGVFCWWKGDKNVVKDVSSFFRSILVSSLFFQFSLHVANVLILGIWMSISERKLIISWMTSKDTSDRKTLQKKSFEQNIHHWRHSIFPRPSLLGYIDINHDDGWNIDRDISLQVWWRHKQNMSQLLHSIESRWSINQVYFDLQYCNSHCKLDVAIRWLENRNAEKLHLSLSYIFYISLTRTIEATMYIRWYCKV